MTTPPPTLDTVFAADTGAPLTDPPAGATVTQTALAAHLFLWALDAYLFAGPDARRATELYGQEGWALGPLDVFAYKITETVDGVMSLTRVL